jgi:DNA-binding transcriptional ArsR family regulator
MLGFAALSTEVRIKAIKLLSRAGDEGLPSGEIAKTLNIPANSLSQQLTVLSEAGLVTQEREGRNVFYAINFDALRKLIKYLAVDCAAGHMKGVKING